MRSQAWERCWTCRLASDSSFSPAPILPLSSYNSSSYPSCSTVPHVAHSGKNFFQSFLLYSAVPYGLTETTLNALAQGCRRAKCRYRCCLVLWRRTGMYWAISSLISGINKYVMKFRLTLKSVSIQI